MQESIAKVILHSKTQQSFILIHKFSKKSAIVPSDQGIETYAPRPLFRHRDITAQLIPEQNTAMDDLGFQNKC